MPLRVSRPNPFLRPTPTLCQFRILYSLLFTKHKTLEEIQQAYGRGRIGLEGRTQVSGESKGFGRSIQSIVDMKRKSRKRGCLSVRNVCVAKYASFLQSNPSSSTFSISPLKRTNEVAVRERVYFGNKRTRFHSARTTTTRTSTKESAALYTVKRNMTSTAQCAANTMRPITAANKERQKYTGEGISE